MTAATTAPAPDVPGPGRSAVRAGGGGRRGRPLLLGVRHHGPGSARAVRAALEAEKPAVVLVEGPAEADALVALAGDESMRPPVALLAHAVDDPGRAAFWPMAEFSPEWVAIRWALDRGAAVRFVDLPAAHTLAAADPTWSDGEGSDGGGDAYGGRDVEGSRDGDGRRDGTGGQDGDGARGEGRGEGGRGEGRRGGDGGRAVVDGLNLRIDPLAELARAAGHEDAEQWWEDVVELRGEEDPTAPFEALAEAMGALREVYGHGGRPRDLVREAYMRLQLRAARKEFGDEVAVVCGAWHVPALTWKTTVAADRALLKGLPKVKAELTWVPWTHRRLARRSGYGAGIEAPGWYGHLFTAPHRPVERWMAKVAGLLRAEDHHVSTAHVIEAVRLAETLAALRGRPLPGLDETTDAVRAVLCEGSDVPLDLVRDRLVVGDVLGEVPAGAPAVPLQRDLSRLQRSLRLKPEAQQRELDLDLRKDMDGARSRLLHRLRLLGVDWGTPAPGRAGTGTFRETWRLGWEPELHVQVAEAGVWGTTVEAAATAKAESRAVTTTALADITALAEQCLLAGLADALPVVMRALADRAALDTDVTHLAQALPALARSLRYGDVRGTDTAALAEVAAGLAERICVGLPPACAGLDADAANAMRERIDEVHQALGLLPDTARPADRWTGVLHRLAARDRVPGVLRGRATRLLLDEGRIAEDEAAPLMSRALSPGAPPQDAAAWIEGFAGGASGGGLLLVHDERLLGLVDTWLTSVPAAAFTDVLPLLRRTFSGYEPGVRRTLGELVARGPKAEGAGHAVPGGVPGFAAGLDRARADGVLPLLHLILGTEATA
ncbi:DUF5682 family protein [Streptomyces narbonensis]|uniref:DUF5682 family protein n=1 Tax=Streptomyces narbonensis TaxID=67333 RepID=UPI0033F505D8